MIGALITFAALFAMIKLFERDREDLEGFNIAMVAIVPVLIVMLAQFLIAYFIPATAVAALLPALLLIAVTFALLWKNLEIPPARAAAYTAVVFLLNQGAAFLLYTS